MNSLSIDTTSVSFALGEVFGVLLVVGGVLTLIWRLSGPWRRVSAPPRPLPAVPLAQLRTRRRNIVVAVLALIAVGGVVAAVSSYNPEPRAADTDAARSDKEPADPPVGTDREVTPFPAGPMGGRLSCGYANTDHGEATVCAWSDAATLGFLTLADVARLDDAALIAVAFRTAAERRS
ncbi:hypothetical protein [Streptomyces platensis]|uniref:hypothetical protein n=1 Tax=Streptomyces platensis TaxID=58346 RepID=UPI00386EFE57|nr:hypothetical protein OG962_00490 [Streptomyces platensis]